MRRPCHVPPGRGLIGLMPQTPREMLLRHRGPVRTSAHLVLASPRLLYGGLLVLAIAAPACDALLGISDPVVPDASRTVTLDASPHDGARDSTESSGSGTGMGLDSGSRTDSGVGGACSSPNDCTTGSLCCVQVTRLPLPTGTCVPGSVCPGEELEACLYESPACSPSEICCSKTGATVGVCATELKCSVLGGTSGGAGTGTGTGKGPGDSGMGSGFGTGTGTGAGGWGTGSGSGACAACLASQHCCVVDGTMTCVSGQGGCVVSVPDAE